MNDNILGLEKVSKLFAKYSFPAIIAMIISGISRMIAGMFLGNYVGSNALASSNLALPFYQLIIGTSMIVSVGSLSLIGRCLGKGDIEMSRDAFRTALITTTTISILITITGRLFNEEIAIALGANDVLLEGVSTYIKTIAIFAPLMSLMYICGFINRVAGHPEVYLRAMLVSFTSNIILNFILVKILNLGIYGGALSLGLSYLPAFCVVIIPLLNKEKVVNIFSGKFDKSIIFPTIYNGASEGVIAIAIATTAYVFNMAFMDVAGPEGVAAFTTISYVGEFGTAVLFGISDGINPIVSYNYGKLNYNRVNETMKISNACGFAIGMILFSILFFFGENLINLFVSDSKYVVELAVRGSKFYAISFLFSGFNIIASGYFTAIGDAKTSIVISACKGIVFVIIGINILPLILGLTGVWLAIPFAEFMAFVVSGLYILRDNKSHKKKIAIV